MGNRQHKCEDCIWYDQCTAADITAEDCADYTPGDSDRDEAYYDSVLAENVAEYRLMMEEYSDGRDS